MTKNLFDPANKVASRIEGKIYRWNEWKEGAQFGGTYLGSHTWTSKEGKEVVAFDFADTTIDGVKNPEDEIHSFNQSYILMEIMEGVEPGQRIGIEYTGQAKPNGKKQGVRLFTPYIDPSNIDENYTRFLKGRPVEEKKEKFLGTEGTETAPEEEAPAKEAKADDEPPFYTIKDIMEIAAGKLGVSDEAGAKVAVKAITGLEVAEPNYNAIMEKLKEQFGA